MFKLPASLLGLTFLAWCNCLADKNAYVSMTKKGFGELAITQCMSGPIFNNLIGMFAASLVVYLNAVHIDMDSLLTIRNQNGEFIKSAVNPLVLIFAQMLVLLLLLLNAWINNYSISFGHSLLNLAIYCVVIACLIIYSIVE
mgnify:CR=1 FL=1